MLADLAEQLALGLPLVAPTGEIALEP